MSNTTTKKRTSTYEKTKDLPEPKLEKGFFHILNAENGRGKTFYLTRVQESILRELNLNNLKLQNSEYTNLICLSGTAFDKFERFSTFKNYLARGERENTFYYYTGYTSNNNFSNVQSPFRTLFDTLYNFYIENKNFNFFKRLDYLSKKLNDLNFESELTIKLQDKSKKYNESRKGKVAEKDLTKRTIKITEFESILQLMKPEKSDKQTLELNDIIFTKKTSVKYNLYELSSGEYSFLRALFTLCLAVQEDSLIIYDEPENSLHPEWQSSLIQILIDVVQEFGKGKSTVLIATHSPLITASFSVENVKISSYFDDDTSNFEWEPYQYYGWSTNTILVRQFNLQSPRPKGFIMLFNSILEEYHNENWENLSREIEQLENKPYFQLLDNDPLYDVLEMIKKDLSKQIGFNT